VNLFQNISALQCIAEHILGFNSWSISSWITFIRKRKWICSTA